MGSANNGKKKKVTFDDIAKYTGFSKTTISRYFNFPDSLTLDNQEIISNALIDLDYKENKVARILANGKTEFIGVIIPNMLNHYYSEMLNRILQTYGDFGYKFLVFLGNEQEETERKYIQELLAYNIEGLIVMSFTLSSEELAKLPIPVVTIEREDRMCPVSIRITTWAVCRQPVCWHGIIVIFLYTLIRRIRRRSGLLMGVFVDFWISVRKKS